MSSGPTPKKSCPVPVYFFHSDLHRCYQALGCRWQASVSCPIASEFNRVSALPSELSGIDFLKAVCEFADEVLGVLDQKNCVMSPLSNGTDVYIYIYIRDPKIDRTVVLSPRQECLLEIRSIAMRSTTIMDPCALAHGRCTMQPRNASLFAVRVAAWGKPSCGLGSKELFPVQQPMASSTAKSRVAALEILDIVYMHKVLYIFRCRCLYRIYVKILHVCHSFGALRNCCRS